MLVDRPVRTCSVLPIRLRSAKSNSSLFEGNHLKNIFVGNLSFQTTEADLRTAFEAFGAVSRVSIMTDRDTGRSRGFAFVEMNDDQQGEDAIAALNGSEMDGRALNVNVARPRPERVGGGGGGPRGGGGGGRGFGGGGGGGRGGREQRW
jgi:RNA recognition motif-containing protein